MTKFSMVETGVDGVTVFQADGSPSLEDCGGIEAAKEFLAAQQRPAINQSGIAPIDKRVLVKPDPADEKVGSIFLPESEKERRKFATMKATMVAVGETAWAEALNEARINGVTFTPPKPGDRVLIAKYGGVELDGADGASYRIMNDEDVIGRLEEQL